MDMRAFQSSPAVAENQSVNCVNCRRTFAISTAVAVIDSAANGVDGRFGNHQNDQFHHHSRVGSGAGSGATGAAGSGRYSREASPVFTTASPNGLASVMFDRSKIKRRDKKNEPLLSPRKPWKKPQDGDYAAAGGGTYTPVSGLSPVLCVPFQWSSHSLKSTSSTLLSIHDVELVDIAHPDVAAKKTETAKRRAAALAERLASENGMSPARASTSELQPPPAATQHTTQSQSAAIVPPLDSASVSSVTSPTKPNQQPVLVLSNSNSECSPANTSPEGVLSPGMPATLELSSDAELPPPVRRCSDPEPLVLDDDDSVVASKAVNGGMKNGGTTEGSNKERGEGSNNSLDTPPEPQEADDRSRMQQKQKQRRQQGLESPLALPTPPEMASPHMRPAADPQSEASSKMQQQAAVEETATPPKPRVALQRWKKAAAKAVRPFVAREASVMFSRAVLKEAAEDFCVDLPFCGRCWRDHLKQLQHKVDEISQENAELEASYLPVPPADFLVLCSHAGDKSKPTKSGSSESENMNGHIADDETTQAMEAELTALEDELSQLSTDLIAAERTADKHRASAEAAMRSKSSLGVLQLVMEDVHDSLAVKLQQAQANVNALLQASLLTVLFRIKLPLGKKEVASINGCRLSGKTTGPSNDPSVVPVVEVNCAVAYMLELLLILADRHRVNFSHDISFRFQGSSSSLEMRPPGKTSKQIKKFDLFITTKFFSWKTFGSGMVGLAHCVHDVATFLSGVAKAQPSAAHTHTASDGAAGETSPMVNAPSSPGREGKNTAAAVLPSSLDPPHAVEGERVGGLVIRHGETPDETFTQASRNLLELLQWCIDVDAACAPSSSAMPIPSPTTPSAAADAEVQQLQ